MIELFFKKIGREDWYNQEILGFSFNGKILNINDLTKIKDLKMGLINIINVYYLKNVI